MVFACDHCVCVRGFVVVPGFEARRVVGREGLLVVVRDRLAWCCCGRLKRAAVAPAMTHELRRSLTCFLSFCWHWDLRKSRIASDLVKPWVP